MKYSVLHNMKFTLQNEIYRFNFSFIFMQTTFSEEPSVHKINDFK